MLSWADVVRKCSNSFLIRFNSVCCADLVCGTLCKGYCGREWNGIVKLVTEQRMPIQQNMKPHRTSFILHFLFSHSSAIDRTVRLFFVPYLFSFFIAIAPDVYIISPIWYLLLLCAERKRPQALILPLFFALYLPTFHPFFMNLNTRCLRHKCLLWRSSSQMPIIRIVLYVSAGGNGSQSHVRCDFFSLMIMFYQQFFFVLLDHEYAYFRDFYHRPDSNTLRSHLTLLS